MLIAMTRSQKAKIDSTKIREKEGEGDVPSGAGRGPGIYIPLGEAPGGPHSSKGDAAEGLAVAEGRVELLQRPLPAAEMDNKHAKTIPAIALAPNSPTKIQHPRNCMA